jgi:hypothetical protein
LIGIIDVDLPEDDPFAGVENKAPVEGVERKNSIKSS